MATKWARSPITGIISPTPPPEVRAKHFLIIGPWDHAGTRTPTDEVAGVKFGPGAILDLNDLHRQWYDWTMKSGAKPEFLKNQVAYYLFAPGNSGANGEWKYADSLKRSPRIHEPFISIRRTATQTASFVRANSRRDERRVPGNAVGTRPQRINSLTIRSTPAAAKTSKEPIRKKKPPDSTRRFALSIGKDGSGLSHRPVA